jgi:hypothetical protein
MVQTACATYTRAECIRDTALSPDLMRAEAHWRGAAAPLNCLQRDSNSNSPPTPDGSPPPHHGSILTPFHRSLRLKSEY